MDKSPGSLVDTATGLKVVLDPKTLRTVVTDPSLIGTIEHMVISSSPTPIGVKSIKTGPDGLLKVETTLEVNTEEDFLAWSDQFYANLRPVIRKRQRQWCEARGVSMRAVMLAFVPWIWQHGQTNGITIGVGHSDYSVAEVILGPRPVAKPVRS